jgi:hypothetical protein
MKNVPNPSERTAVVLIWLGTAVFVIGAVLFGH